VQSRDVNALLITRDEEIVSNKGDLSGRLRSGSFDLAEWRRKGWLLGSSF
jgi:hypothetical protein